jgi:drug/metabolite transporter (DMT)-like permease
MVRTVLPPHLPSDPAATSAAAALPGMAGMLAGASAMVFVGGSVAVSGVLSGSPLFTAQAVRHTAACLLLLAAARLTGQRLVLPSGAEWVWLLGVAATGLVVFNLALVEGSRHAEPAVLGVAVACVPLVLAVAAPLMDGGRPSPTIGALVRMTAAGLAGAATAAGAAATLTPHLPTDWTGAAIVVALASVADVVIYGTVLLLLGVDEAKWPWRPHRAAATQQNGPSF